MRCPQIIISEYNQNYHISPSCYYVLDLLCVSKVRQRGGNWGSPLGPPQDHSMTKLSLALHGAVSNNLFWLWNVKTTILNEIYNKNLYWPLLLLHFGQVPPPPPPPSVRHCPSPLLVEKFSQCVKWSCSHLKNIKKYRS